MGRELVFLTSYWSQRPEAHKEVLPFHNGGNTLRNENYSTVYVVVTPPQSRAGMHVEKLTQSPQSPRPEPSPLFFPDVPPVPQPSHCYARSPTVVPRNVAGTHTATRTTAPAPGVPAQARLLPFPPITKPRSRGQPHPLDSSERFARKLSQERERARRLA